MSKAQSFHVIALLLLIATISDVALARKKPRNRAAAPAVPVASNPNEPNKYDFYTLAQEWYGTVCRVEDCAYWRKPETQEPIRHFNLHGLWPNTWDKTTTPFECDKENKLLFGELTDKLRNEIEARWNGLYHPTERFLTHEWEKHGTCWNPDLVPETANSVIQRLLAQVSSPYKKKHVDLQSAYFKRTIRLAESFNFYDILEQSGITPRMEPYPLKQVRQAILRHLNIKDMVIRCATVKDAEGNKSKLIQEVRICTDLGYNPINCPAYMSPHNDCGSDERVSVYYYPFTQ